MSIVKISNLPLVDQPVEGTDLFVVVQGDVTKKAFASDIQTYVGFEEVQTATAGQTVFNLTTMTYAAGANNLMVFVDGVNQYEGSSYTETDNNTVTFSQGLHEGALVKFSTVQTQTSLVNNAGAVVYNPAGSGAVPTNVQAKLRETVSIMDFGADPTGVADSYNAFVAALAASDAVFVPAGTFKVGTQIDITGNKVIYGLGGNNFEALPSRINFTAASGNLFSATSAEFGGIVIRNLWIIGGNGDYAIRSSRPQSVFENILMEVYDGSGIQLFEAGTGSQASWATVVKDVKWVGPATQTPYRGFDITQNGGLITLYRCTAIRGSIGININQGEAIDIVSCSLNLQTSTTSSLGATDQCCIRLSGGGYKKAVSIRNSYIEAYTYGIYVEKCESLSIENNYLADVGFSSNYSSIYLKDNNVNNVTIRNNNISDTGNTHNGVEIGDGANSVYVLNNYIIGSGTNAVGIKKGTTTRSYVESNTFTMNISTGTTIADPNFLIVDLDFAANGFLSYSRKDFTSVDNTWYDLGAVGNDQIWRIVIMDSNSPNQSRFCQDLVISKTGTATFETIYDVNPGFAIRELRVSGGKIQFRTTSAGGNTANTVTAMRLV